MFSLFKRNKSISNQTKSNSPYSRELSKNIDYIKERTGKSPDVIVNCVQTGSNKINIAVVYIEGLVDNTTIKDFLLDSLIHDKSAYGDKSDEEILEHLSKDVLPLSGIEKGQDWKRLFESLLAGETLVLIDGLQQALTISSTVGGDKRAIGEPTTQTVIRGSKEGLTEYIDTNLAMVRRIIRNENLWIESMKLGTQTNTDISIMYMKNIVNEDIVQEVRKRLSKIKIDAILESGYIEQLIQDQPKSPFPQVFHTERPDVIAGNLLEGRVAIFVNGTPFVLLVPVVFAQFFQTPEDYYYRSDIASSLRLLRILIYFISLLGPSIYIAAGTFHQEMMPTKLALVIASQRENVPFPAIVEALIMEITFEILREAGLRLPRPIGATVSIVGGLVIGQAAVQAGIVSPPMVIAVSLTAISSFATPTFDIAISSRLLRFAIMICAASFGFFGIMLALMGILVHLCSLRSFGVPYMAPFGPFVPSNLGDTLIRAPWWLNKKRPYYFSKNRTRVGENQYPNPPGKRTLFNSNDNQEKN